MVSINMITFVTGAICFVLAVSQIHKIDPGEAITWLQVVSGLTVILALAAIVEGLQ